MPDASPMTGGGLSHTIFLERTPGELASPPQGSPGQAAFLVLRLVDLLASVPDSSSHDDLFRYQSAATARYCREQVEPGAHADHLLGLVRSANDASRQRNPGLIATAMLAFASFLEDEARYEEALDVLQTLGRAAGPSLHSVDAVTAALHEGRLLRQIARFDQATAAFETAAALAAAAGDKRSGLLSRLGRANVFWGRGNLAEAERWNREVLLDARAAGERDAAARAEHDIGMILGTRGQVPDAVPHLWRAYELYEDESRSLRALTDLGFALARLGAIEDAECAFKYVVEKSHTPSAVQNAMIELMYCASFRRDRVGFRRWRSGCEKAGPRMAPNTLADYHLKVGIGLARFGRFTLAMPELDQALQVAQANGLHEFEFRIERIRAGLRDCEALGPAEHAAVAEPLAQATALLEVSAALATLDS